ncbi:uncharacterized protein LOC127860972 [Dreissena polymorpha]|nr:uncharacterized protein LOC127860972 [Dreissena polymorpha]
MKGDGMGCDYTAKMIFAIESSMNKKTGYYLTGVPDWAIANSHIAGLANDGDDIRTRAVVLILNANLHEWMYIIEHEICPSAITDGTLTVIMTTKDETFDDKIKHLVLDASNYDALPTELDKAHVFDMMAKLKGPGTIISGDTYKPNEASKHHSHPTITTSSKEIMLKSLGTHMWIRRLKAFFAGTMEEGSLFFRKPDTNLVNDFRILLAKGIDPQVLCLIITYVFGRFDLTHAEYLHNSQANKVIQIKFAQPSKLVTKKNQYPRYKHIAKYFNTGLRQGLINIRVGLKQVQDSLLIDKESQFAGEHIRTSFMVALNEVIPAGIIESCDDDFLFHFVRSDETIGASEYALLRSEEGFRAFFKRMMFQWKQSMKTCIEHPVLFRNFEGFLKYIATKKHMRWNILSQLENSKCSLYYGMDSGDQGKTPTEIILTDGKWTQKRNKRSLRVFTQEQEAYALVHAAELKNVRIFECLVKYGVPITQESFSAALKSNSADIIEYCLKEAAFNDKVWTNCLYECIIINIGCSKTNINYRILEKCMCAKKSLLKMICTDTMPLLHRVVNNQMMLEILLEGTWSEHVNVNAVYQNKGDNGTTALVLATEEGNQSAVEYLLKKGADQRLTGVDEMPMCIAAKYGHLNIVKALVNNDKTIIKEPGNHQELPITIARRCGFNDIVKFIEEIIGSA